MLVLLPIFIGLVVFSACLCRMVIFNKIVCIIYSIMGVILYINDIENVLTHAMIFGFGFFIYFAPLLTEDTRGCNIFLFGEDLVCQMYGDSPLRGFVMGLIFSGGLAILWGLLESVIGMVWQAVGFFGCIVMVVVNIVGLVRYIRSEY